MCGIVGFCGDKQAAPILLDGLSKLEYRGYDSAGLAVRDGSAQVQIVKAKGRLKELYAKLMADKASLVPAVSVIPDGQLMANLPKLMRIRMQVLMAM